MSQDRPTDEFPFADLAPPGPPAELRGRVLALAREALAEPAAPDVWTRIWGSRPLRLAWAVAAILLVIANIGISVRRHAAGAVVFRFVARTEAESERDADRELAALVALYPIDESVQPLVGRSEVDASSPERKPAPSRGGLS